MPRQLRKTQAFPEMPRQLRKTQAFPEMPRQLRKFVIYLRLLQFWKITHYGGKGVEKIEDYLQVWVALRLG